MTKQTCTITFSHTKYPPITLEKHQNLSEHLTIQNSPVLFGCRTGICGTCIVIVNGNIPPANTEEREILDTLAPENQQVRLACQLDITNDIEITLFAEE